MEASTRHKRVKICSILIPCYFFFLFQSNMSKGQVDGGGDKSDGTIGPFIVAAIDFGTTFSGYAFSFKHDYDKDPTQVRIHF